MNFSPELGTSTHELEAPTPSSERNRKRLRNYAEWYILRYAPSKNRLLLKLSQRAISESDARAIFLEVEGFLDDRASIRSQLEGRISLGKGFRGFRTKLLTKGFHKDDIDAVFDESSDSMTDWDARKRFVERKMHSYIEKGKSKTEAGMLLRAEFREFSSRISILIQDMYPEDLEILKVLQNIKPQLFKGVQKSVFERLARKGFRYSDIRKTLQTEEN